ncbi:MAG TPA: hypothetical protein VGR92_20520 [Steroidobacteraceae bacterium]|nr:hypothetical protein [Steroidobacteraceae bacterium]
MKNLLWIFLLVCDLAYARASLPDLTAAQWRQDLGYFGNEIATKHRDPYHFIAKAKFDQSVSDLRQRIPSLKDYEVVVGLQHLAALIGDGHTFLDTRGLYERFPLEVFWFGHDLRVVRAAPEYRQALGTRLVAIGSFSIREVQLRLQQLIPQGENQWYVLDSSAQQVVSVEPLTALGILPNLGPADFTFEDDSGRRFELRIKPVAPDISDSAEVAGNPVPLPFQHPDDPLWFTYLAGSKTVYVDFRSYQDLKARAARLVAYVAKLPVKRLIIDMRWNGGGDYTKGREYLIYKIAYMAALNRAGHLFVITGRRTFSAAMVNVTDFRRETEAILVGEPTGARPNGYQENYWFTLPLSKLRVSCSMLKYRFQPESETDAVFPDQRIDPSWRSFRAGKDAALQWILAQPFPDRR